MRKTTTVLTTILAFLMSTSLQAQEQTSTKPDSTDKAKPIEARVEPTKANVQLAAEKAFQTLLSGATLVGNFTVNGAEKIDAAKLLNPDRYELYMISKAKGDYWQFIYDHKGIPIPLQIKVLWAGTTPILTLDEFTIAGMGTFSARLMFHDNQYAGTWRHGKKHGLMFGKIETREFKAAQRRLDSQKLQLRLQNAPELKK